MEEKRESQMSEEGRIAELMAENARLKKQVMEQAMELAISRKMIEISDNLKDPAVKKKIEQELSKLFKKTKENRTEEDIAKQSWAIITE